MLSSILIYGLFSSFAANAVGVTESPYLSAYCTALMETQIRPEALDPQLLQDVFDQAEDKLTQAVGKLKRDTNSQSVDGYLHLWLNDSKQSSISVKNAPERMAVLRRDLVAIQPDVIAGAVIHRGQDAILKYLADVERVTWRNHEDLRPYYEKAFPYVRPSRIIIHSLIAGVPLIYLGGLGYWAGEAMVNLHLGILQSATILGTAVAGVKVGPLIIQATGMYVRGLFSDEYRVAYENSLGRPVGIHKFRRLNNLRSMIENPRRRTRVLIHLTDDRTVSGEEKSELLAAAREERSVSPAFLEEFERGDGPRNIRMLDDPLTYELRFDMIYFYDDKTDEPVLITVDRISRSKEWPTPRRRRKDVKATNSKFGELSPVGI